MNNPIEQQQVKAHEEWLKHPITQDLIKILKKRETKHREDLFNKVLKETDEQFENRYRSAINTTQTHINIIIDSKTFVEQQNNKTI